MDIPASVERVRACFSPADRWRKEEGGGMAISAPSGEEEEEERVERRRRSDDEADSATSVDAEALALSRSAASDVLLFPAGARGYLRRRYLRRESGRGAWSRRCGEQREQDDINRRRKGKNESDAPRSKPPRGKN